MVLLTGTLLTGCEMSHQGIGLDENGRPKDKGSYRGHYYEVQKGDTLYFIAYVTNKDFLDIARLNDLKDPYVIKPGQKLYLWKRRYRPPQYGRTGAGPAGDAVQAKQYQRGLESKEKPISSVVSPSSPSTSSPSSSQALASATNTSPPIPTEKVIVSPILNDSDNTSPPIPTEKVIVSPILNNSDNTSKDVNSKENQKKLDLDQKKVQSNHKGGKVVVKTTPPKSTSTATNDKVSSWKWPTKGRVIANFSNTEHGNKGIDIAGKRGQPVVATAKGQVVYAGSALRGYGNLLIIKHNDQYLSAYAHNDKLYVNEGQSVKAGEKIASMGSTGTDGVKLHFEIRYHGKSVNPKHYLP